MHIDSFRTRSHNFFDHGNVNYDFDGNRSRPIFLSPTTEEALIRGCE